MIKNIIFDFGDIFIDLDKEAPLRLMKSFGLEKISSEMHEINQNYEKGLINNMEFLEYYKRIFPKATTAELITAWNSMILKFPEYRLNFIRKLKDKGQYRLFLLSNTNTLHIEKVIENMGMNRYKQFKACFEKFYLSHEIQMRKPNLKIYEFVLQEDQLSPHETLFIDDTKENTDAAALLGIHTWNLIPKQEDIVDVFRIDKPWL